MLWLILPAFNEEHSLPQLLADLDDEMRKANRTFRLVALDDGSTDQTRAILVAHAARMPIDIIVHPLNRGLGETERDGFEYVAGRCRPDDIVVRIEGDFTHKPQYVEALLAKLAEGYDVVTTSRFQPGGGQRGVDPSRARISRAANIFMAFIFRLPNVREYSCGFRAYRARVLQDAVRVFGGNLLQLRGLGFTSTLEIIVKLHLLGCRFAEVPFVLRYDDKRSPSKMIGSITTLGYMTMALLFHWPFGGWKRQYRGLREMYLADPDLAMARFGIHTLKTDSSSQVAQGCVDEPRSRP